MKQQHWREGALQAVETLPPSTERDEQELGLRLILAFAIMTLKAFAAEEVKDIVNPALELCARHRASSQGLHGAMVAGLFRTTSAERSSFAAKSCATHGSSRGCGRTCYACRRPPSIGDRACGAWLAQDALEHFDQVSALYDPDPLWHMSAVRWTASTGVSDCFAARALWLPGYPDQALKRVERGMSLAQRSATLKA